MRAFKANMDDGHGWMSQCQSGLDHGLASMPDGREVPWPARPWFGQDGMVELPGVGMVRIERQEGGPA